ncbi:ABC transporter, permease protein [Aeropyrum pernix]|uniref:ABC transporter, permease protein n=1 Tax=Aeropyrum pernix TaxID=56636 RepID=A0A401HBS2_AERPX|nr:ABC transporter permease [Aeropyrum pernix]GBF09891.1 ABC transporter, permease protein [Aeropyrum pernix]
MVEIVISAVLTTLIPLSLAALGEAVLERTGRVNLGVDGLMAVGAAVGALAGVETGSLLAGLAAGALAGGVGSLSYIILTDRLGVNMIVAGLLVFFAGIGLGDLVGSKIAGRPGPVLTSLYTTAATIGIAAAALHLILYNTVTGTALRVVGENPAAAEERGVPVWRLRLSAALVQGVSAGLAGYIMVAGLSYGKWYSGVTAGLGWVALGIVILGYWTPIGVLIASTAVSTVFSMRTQIAAATGIPPLADAIPYILVLILLAAGTHLYERIGLRPPASIWRRR